MTTTRNTHRRSPENMTDAALRNERVHLAEILCRPILATRGDLDRFGDLTDEIARRITEAAPAT